MIKERFYRYIGRNGIVTTPVLLEGIARIDLYQLKADTGKILTDGERQLYNVFIEVDELYNWKEIADNPDK